MTNAYQQMGGDETVAIVVEDFYRRVLDDPALAHVDPATTHPDRPGRPRPDRAAPGDTRRLAERLDRAGVAHWLVELRHARRAFDLSWGGVGLTDHPGRAGRLPRGEDHG